MSGGNGVTDHVGSASEILAARVELVEQAQRSLVKESSIILAAVQKLGRDLADTTKHLGGAIAHVQLTLALLTGSIAVDIPPPPVDVPQLGRVPKRGRRKR